MRKVAGEKMKLYKNNHETLISSINSVRSDHFDGINAIYRLVAYVPILLGVSVDGIRRQAQKLIKDIDQLSVRPNQIFIFDNMIEIVWYAKDYQMVMNRGQYLGLVFEFVEFLNNASIQDLYIKSGFFSDDPDDSVKCVSNDMINFFPEFNQECFGAGWNEPIKIVNLNRNLGSSPQ
ncbi:hypothetical protein [Bacillus salipaludis]|uniref:Uncharacterized protein n=1 Tax=Bacillus salipaludis TaxID=2547811 RepID=A0ABW8RE12_9BACI